MAELSLMASALVSESVQELNRIADSLGMPTIERCSILGLSRTTYRFWHDGNVDAAVVAAPELVRRLNYALPLMRRMAANMPIVPAGRSQVRPRPVAN